MKPPVGCMHHASALGARHAALTPWMVGICLLVMLPAARAQNPHIAPRTVVVPSPPPAGAWPGGRSGSHSPGYANQPPSSYRQYEPYPAPGYRQDPYSSAEGGFRAYGRPPIRQPYNGPIRPGQDSDRDGVPDTSDSAPFNALRR